MVVNRSYLYHFEMYRHFYFGIFLARFLLKEQKAITGLMEFTAKLGKGTNGESQGLHICYLANIYNLYSCVGLPVEPIEQKSDVKEINDGTLYFTGNIRGISTFLVFRQPGCEVVE